MGFFIIIIDKLFSMKILDKMFQICFPVPKGPKVTTLT